MVAMDLLYLVEREICIESVNNLRAPRPGVPANAVGTFDIELVDDVAVVYLEDEVLGSTEAVLRSEDDRVANLDLVLHGSVISRWVVGLHTPR